MLAHLHCRALWRGCYPRVAHGSSPREREREREREGDLREREREISRRTWENAGTRETVYLAREGFAFSRTFDIDELSCAHKIEPVKFSHRKRERDTDRECCGVSGLSVDRARINWLECFVF